jgi:hypothetical protein
MEEKEIYFMGIDPGMKGAIAILLPKPGTFGVFTLVDMPMVEGWYDPEAILRLMNVKRVIVGLEESYRWPKLCKGIGILWTCGRLAVRVEKLIMVRPQAWQKFHGIKKAAKDVSLKIARKLFPSQKRMLSLGKDHNRAEALLIADFVRSTFCRTSR